MKRFSCHIITLILLVSGTIFLQSSAYAATDVEIYGQIGGNQTSSHPPKESEAEADTGKQLAQPKQKHIELRRFPNTGSVVEKITPIGLILLMIYLLVNRWKAHRKEV